MHSEDAPVTEGDADLLDRMARNDGSMRLVGYDRVRCRRMAKLGLARQSLNFEFGDLTPAGRHFLQRRARHREAGAP